MPKVLKIKARGNGPLATGEFEGHEFECVVGKNGVIAPVSKREGDGMTPLGRWMLVDGFYRPDRKRPRGICTQKLNIGMGWCDEPDDKLYNKLCDTTLAASHEKLWREGAEYDYIGVMNYNLAGRKAPDGQGWGSAIFLHIWREEATHTEGCVALRAADLDIVLSGGVDTVEIMTA